MKKVLALLILTVQLFSLTVDGYYKQITQISKAQEVVLIDSLDSKRVYGADYLLAGISWQESVLGKYKENRHDGHSSLYPGSYGYYHNLLTSVMLRHGLNPNKKGYEKQAAAYKFRLMHDFKFSQSEALAELSEWKSFWQSKGYKGTELNNRVIASYNAGYWSTHSKAGREYVKAVTNRAEAIKRYVASNDKLASQILSKYAYKSQINNYVLFDKSKPLIRSNSSLAKINVLYKQYARKEDKTNI